MNGQQQQIASQSINPDGGGVPSTEVSTNGSPSIAAAAIIAAAAAANNPQQLQQRNTAVQQQIQQQQMSNGPLITTTVITSAGGGVITPTGIGAVSEYDQWRPSQALITPFPAHQPQGGQTVTTKMAGSSMAAAAMAQQQAAADPYMPSYYPSISPPYGTPIGDVAHALSNNAGHHASDPIYVNYSTGAAHPAAGQHTLGSPQSPYMATGDSISLFGGSYFPGFPNYFPPTAPDYNAWGTGTTNIVTAASGGAVGTGKSSVGQAGPPDIYRYEHMADHRGYHSFENYSVRQIEQGVANLGLVPTAPVSGGILDPHHPHHHNAGDIMSGVGGMTAPVGLTSAGGQPAPKSWASIASQPAKAPSLTNQQKLMKQRVPMSGSGVMQQPRSGFELDQSRDSLGGGGGRGGFTGRSWGHGSSGRGGRSSGGMTMGGGGRHGGHSPTFDANDVSMGGHMNGSTPPDSEHKHMPQHPVLEKLNRKYVFNPKEYNINTRGARFFVIKSYSEDDIHRSIKYSIWCSTEHGNKRLDNAFRGREANKGGPIYLFFSVNGSGHFCGVAEMLSSVDYGKSANVWMQDKWKGEFKVRWIYVKDVPNSKLRSVRLENNENKPVTNSRDTQEVPYQKGLQVMELIHGHPHTTCIFDDFGHYEKRQEEEETRRNVPGGGLDGSKDDVE